MSPAMESGAAPVVHESYESPLAPLVEGIQVHIIHLHHGVILHAALSALPSPSTVVRLNQHKLFYT